MATNIIHQRHMGKVVGLIGLKGKLKVNSNTNSPQIFLSVQDLFFRHSESIDAIAFSTKENFELVDNSTVKIRINKIKHERQCFFICLKDYVTAKSVEPLLGCDVFAPTSQLLPLEDNQWWVDDLIGARVVTEENEHIGTVCSIVGHNSEWLEVQKDRDESSKTILIPFVKQLVPIVDCPNRLIVIHNLPGLLED